MLILLKVVSTVDQVTSCLRQSIAWYPPPDEEGEGGRKRKLRKHTRLGEQNHAGSGEGYDLDNDITAKRERWFFLILNDRIEDAENHQDNNDER